MNQLEFLVIASGFLLRLLHQLLMLMHSRTLQWFLPKPSSLSSKAQFDLSKAGRMCWQVLESRVRTNDADLSQLNSLVPGSLQALDGHSRLLLLPCDNRPTIFKRCSRSPWRFHEPAIAPRASSSLHLPSYSSRLHWLMSLYFSALHLSQCADFVAGRSN